MTRQNLSDFNGRLDAVAKSAALIKWVIGAVIAAAVWGTTLQIQTGNNTRDIAEIREDRRAKIKDYDVWRTEMDKANVKRDFILEQLAKAETSRSPKAR